VIRIRPGRSWRHNPGYLGELRSLTPPRALSYGFSGILDVVGLEVDGVDIAAGVGEAPVLHTVGELVQALLQLAEGAGAAQATVGPGPTEMVLEPRGQDVLLTLCTLRKPARVVASGLLVDAGRLRAATLQAAQALLRDVLDVSPALANARVLKSLSRACAQLSRKAQRPLSPWPSRAAAATPGFVARGVKARVACEVQVPPEAAARLAAAGEVPRAPLAPLLGRGTIALRLPGAPALSLEGPPWILLRELVRESSELVQAWEAGERSFALAFGGTELTCDLTRNHARAPAFSEPAHAPAVQIAAALAGAARAFADRSQRLAIFAEAKGPRHEPLADLGSAAEALLAHCRDLASGDLRRAPDAVPAPSPQAHGSSHPPLGAGKLRRLVLREVFREELPATPDALSFHAGLPGAVLLARTGADLDARDGATGRPLFRRELSPLHAGGVPPVRAGSDLVVEVRETFAATSLVRFDLATGAPRFRRRMRGAAASLHGAGSGVVRATADGSWSLVSAEGRAALRGALPEAPVAVFQRDGVLVFCLPSGLVLGKGAQDGKGVFRRHAGEQMDAALAVGPLVVCSTREGGSSQLVALDAASGAEAWRLKLPARPQPGSLAAAGESLALVCGSSLLGLRLRDGARRFEAPLPWPVEAGFLSPVDELEEKAVQKASLRSPGFLATGPDGAAVRFDERGARLWSLDPSSPQPAAPALLYRGVALLSREGLSLHDAAEGLPLSRVCANPPQRVALAPDLTVALVDGRSALVILRLATHLSLV
jgi:hypothetical protein